MHDASPLLDVADAMCAADEALQDAGWHLSQEYYTADQAYPPDVQEAMDTLARSAARLATALPDTLTAAIARERAFLEDEAARWEPSDS